MKFQLRCMFWTEWRYEARLDLARARGLRHYRQRTKIFADLSVCCRIENAMSGLHLAELLALSFSRKVRTDNAHLAKFGPLSMAIAGTSR